MSELFVAPEGAMQFEVTVGPGRKPCRPFSLWVGKPIEIIDARPPNCEHIYGYPVIDFCDIKNPLRDLSQIDKGRHDNKPVLVCPCIGRIIE